MNLPKSSPDSPVCTLEYDENLEEDRFFAELSSMGYTARAGIGFRDRITWFDTQNGALYKAGYRLSHSSLRRQWVLTRKGKNLASLEGPVSPPPVKGDLADSLAGLTGMNPFVPHLEMLSEQADYHVLSPVIIGITLTLERREYRVPPDEEVRGRKTVIKVSSDMDSPSQVAYLVRLITGRFGFSVVGTDSFLSGLGLTGRPFPGAPVPKSLAVSSDDSYEEVCRKIIGIQGHRMWANTHGTIHDLDREYLHDLRVATRRARFALKLFEDVTGTEYAEGLRAELKWIAGILGEVRDLDVFLERIHLHLRQIRPDPGFSRLVEDHLEARRQDHLKNLRTALEDDRCKRLVDELKAFPKRKIPGHHSAAAAGSRLIYKTVKKFSRWMSTPPQNLCTEDLHRLRIQFKSLRYISEFFRVFFDKELGRHIRVFIGFQDCLGLFHDATVAEVNLGRLAADMAGKLSETDLLSLGALMQLQRNMAEEQRREFVETWENFHQSLDSLLNTVKRRGS